MLLLLSVSLCAAVRSAAPSQLPTQQRIALLPDGMTVSWSTSQPLPSAPSVLYGLSPSSLNLTAQGVSQHYDSAASYFHHVELRRLSARTRYYWQVAAVNQSQSPILDFVTAAPVGAADRPLVAAVYGDMGLNQSEQTRSLLHAIQPKLDLVVHVGDIGYANAYFRVDATYENVWEQYMTNMTGLTSATPYMTCPGNHEVVCKQPGCAEGQRNFTAYRQRFHMPGADSGGFESMYYSYDVGTVHFVMINTESDFPGAAEGDVSGPFGSFLPWLQGDLVKAAANRKQVPWIVVVGHRPFFLSGGDSNAVQSQPMRDAFFPILEQFHVDLIVTAHVHLYQRSFPLAYNGSRCATHYDGVDCPVFLISAAAGNLEGLSALPAPSDAIAYQDREFGIGLLTVYNRSALTWQFVRSSDHAVLDEFTITKSAAKTLVAEQ